MKKIVSLLVIALLALACYAVADESPKLSLKAGDKVFVCNCGEACPCLTMAKRASQCSCGKDMVEATVTKVEEGTAVVRIGEREQTFQTTGKFTCACGAGCDCGTISQNPGNCACGRPLGEVKSN